MKRMFAYISVLFLLGGCTFIKENLNRPNGENIAEAVSLLEKGNEAGAVKLLESICNSNKKVEGVTDEAMFRLSLLELRKDEDSAAIQAIQKRLARLQSDYPESQWARMSWPLTEYINQSETLKSDLRSIRHKYNSMSKENRELQNTVQNLTKENKEINQMIEKLKSLDLELEKKNLRK